MSPFPQTRDHRANREPNEPAVVTDGRLLVDLGGTIVEIESVSREWLSEVRDRYGAFVCRGAVADIKIVHNPDKSSVADTHGCLSVLQPGARGAEITCASGTEVLDGVLRTLMPTVIAPDLMMHGAVLSDGNRGFLCCGVSGSGKSTIASLFPEYAVCDELARLHVGAARVEVRSLPFWQARPASIGLSAIFMIEHGRENRRSRLSGSDAVKALRRHVYWPVEHAEMMQQSFGTMVEICRDTPVFRLAFLPERSVWITMTQGI